MGRTNVRHSTGVLLYTARCQVQVVVGWRRVVGVWILSVAVRKSVYAATVGRNAIGARAPHQSMDAQISTVIFYKSIGTYYYNSIFLKHMPTHIICYRAIHLMQDTRYFTIIHRYFFFQYILTTIYNVQNLIFMDRNTPNNILLRNMKRNM